MRMKRATLAVLCAASAVAVAACGDDNNDKASSAPKTAAVTATEAGKRPKLSIAKSIPAGVVTVTLTNTGKFPHEASLIRIDDGHSTVEAIKAFEDNSDAPIPTWIHGAGGTGPVAPGGSASATQRLVPGSYVLGDSAARDQELKLKAGAVAFKVEGEAGGGDLPATTAKIEAFEYGFKTSGLKAGKNTIEFSNTGKELHHVIAAPFRPGATLAQVKKAFEKENGQPPLDFDNVRGTTVLDGGAKQVTELDFAKPGKYALLCFIQDRAGGPPHVAKGMVAEVDVR